MSAFCSRKLSVLLQNKDSTQQELTNNLQQTKPEQASVATCNLNLIHQPSSYSFLICFNLLSNSEICEDSQKAQKREQNAPTSEQINEHVHCEHAQTENVHCACAKYCRGPLSSLPGWSLAMSLCEWPLVRGDYETVRRIELPNSISVVSFYLFCASMYFLCLCST